MGFKCFFPTIVSVCLGSFLMSSVKCSLIYKCTFFTSAIAAYAPGCLRGFLHAGAYLMCRSRTSSSDCSLPCPVPGEHLMDLHCLQQVNFKSARASDSFLLPTVPSLHYDFIINPALAFLWTCNSPLRVSGVGSWLCS